MLKPPIPIDEEDRLETLHGMKLLDTPLEEGFERVTRLAKTMFDVPIAAISLIEEQRQWFKSMQGLDVLEISRDISMCSHAILQDEVFIVPDTLSDERFKDNPLVEDQPKIRFYAGCPIKAVNGQKLGTLCLIDKKPREFSKSELLSLKDLAALVELTMKNRRISYAQEILMDKLNQARLTAMIDPLTRLWNREGMTQILNYQLQDHHSPSFGLALLDIDHFKKINDEYGHTIGDEALRAISQYLLSSCREEDAVGRWGGEEFIILLNAQDPETLLHICDRIRTTLAGIPICVADQQTINVSVTIGLTLVEPRHDLDLESYIKRADEALYGGKNSGRNQVVMR